jgi:hypothetical protein
VDQWVKSAWIPYGVLVSNQVLVKLFPAVFEIRLRIITIAIKIVIGMIEIVLYLP